MMIRIGKRALLIVGIALLTIPGDLVTGQARSREQLTARSRGSAKPITVPVTIRVKESEPRPETRYVDFLLREDGEMQELLSRRSSVDSPLYLAILIQDDLIPPVGNEIKGLAEFIRRQPAGSKVMIGYIRSGSLDLRRKFTSDLDRAASSLRIPIGSPSASPFNPYIEVIEALRRFDSQPLGRRAIIVVSDGLDTSRGTDSSLPSLSVDLQRAINESQRRSVAVYSIYSPSIVTAGSQLLGANGQSCLERLSNETGGRAYFAGTGAPVSFDPFLKEIDSSLTMQIALTYLSTHTKKGFHRLDIKPIEKDVEIRHPAGYTR